MLSCSNPIPKIAVSGSINGQAVSTTVDSELARYYLTRTSHQIAPNHEFDAILSQIDAIKGIPQADALEKVSLDHSTDVAAILLAKRILADPLNYSVQDRFSAYYERLKLGDLSKEDLEPLAAPDHIILFVPGWLYERNPETGADFARQRKRLDEVGVANRLIAIDQNGTVGDNAEIIYDALVHESTQHERITLVSASKGGPEAALALTMLNNRRAEHNLKGWINVGGVLRGTALTEKARTWPWNWFARLFVLRTSSSSGFQSLDRPLSRKRHEGFDPPKDVAIINYVAIPLSGNVADRAMMGYKHMRPMGPNDGLTLILDEIADEGPCVVEIGLDHYYAHDDIDLKTVALGLTIQDLIRQISVK